MYRPETFPPELAHALSLVRALPVADSAAMSAEERAGWLVGLQQLVAAAQASSLQVLAAFDAAGDGETLHAARSTSAWLRGALRIAGGDAATRVRLARGSRHEIRRAVRHLHDGDVTYDHVRVIAGATRALPVHQVDDAAELLTGLATQTDVTSVAQASRHLSAVVDPDGTLSAAERDYSRRRLTLSPLLDGTVVVDGLLDAEAAATVNAALEPFLVPAGPDDERGTPQRRADGLVALAQTAMTQTELPVSGRTRPVLNVLTSLSTLTSATGQGSGVLDQAPGGGGVIGSPAVRRVGCDAGVARVLLDTAGVPVELGRTQRLFTVDQRRLLAHRDGGCRFPGCGLPAAFTDAHHLVPWHAGGATDLTNAILVCRHHHRALHEGGWRASPQQPSAGANGPIVFAAPRGKAITTRPRNLTTHQLDAIAWWTFTPPDTS